MFSSSWFACNEIAQLQICIWSHTFAQLFLPVIEHLALFRRGHHSPSALLSKSISEEQATYLHIEHFTNAKETKPLLFDVNLWSVFIIRFQANLTMTFCLMLLILFPAVFH